MFDTRQEPSTRRGTEIRIARLNTDKTRKVLGSHTVYQVFFELSESPPWEWRDIFGREWKNLNPKEEAVIDGKFLVIHSPLQEIAAMYLPALKTAVADTNVEFEQYVQEQITAGKRKAEAWKEERKAVEEVAGSLQFETPDENRGR
jgi:hypothetical protein